MTRSAEDTPDKCNRNTPRHENSRFQDLAALSDQLLSNAFMEEGACIAESVIPRVLLNETKRALHLAMEAEKELHREQDDDSLVVCCPFYDDVFLEILRGAIFEAVDVLLGKSSIIYSYNNSCMQPRQGNFSSNVHVERHYSTGDYLEALGLIVLLDDFTESNGATWYLPRSQRQLKRPDDAFFYKHAKRLIAPAGSLFFFHPNLWHAGGINETDSSRWALSIGFCRSYMKQRIDLTAMFADRRDLFPDDVRQKLGFDAKSPSDIAGFYARKGGWED